MSRFELFQDLPDADTAERGVSPEVQEEISKDTKFLGKVQEELIKGYCKDKAGGVNNQNAMAWIAAYGKNFREHIVNNPEHVALLQKYRDASSETEEQKIMKQIEDELYSVMGIFG